MKKRYLFIPDMTKGNKLLEKVCTQFQKVAILNEEIELLVLIPSNVTTTFNSYYANVSKYLNLAWSEVGASGSNRLIFQTYDSQGIVKIKPLLNQGDCYITGNVRDAEASYLKQAFENHIGIITALSDNIFSDIPKTKIRFAMEKEILSLVMKFFTMMPPSKYEYMLVHQGFGETMTLFYLLPEYVEKIQKPLVVITFNESRKKLLEISPFVHMAINVPLYVYDYLALWVAPEYEWKNFLNLHFMDLERKEEQMFVSEVRDFLGLDPNGEFTPTPLKIPDEAVVTAQEWFEKNHLNQDKTVYLITQGLCYNTSALSHAFWVSLANELIENGYDVIVNGEEALGEKVHNAFLDVLETTALAQMCAGVVSVSTGLLDVLMFGCQKHLSIKILLPDAYNMFWANRFSVEGVCKYGVYFPEQIIKNCKRWWNTEKKIETFLYGDDITGLAKEVANSMENGADGFRHI